MKRSTSLLLAAITSMADPFSAFSQPDVLDITFNPGAGANAWVSSMVLQSNGQIVIAGSFSLFNNMSRNHLARLNMDGSLDDVFYPGEGPNNMVRTVLVQPDGRVLIGGDFYTVNSLQRDALARLRADGSLDLSLPYIRINGSVVGLAMQDDGRILIGGNFTSINSTNRNYLARIHPQGSLDTSFNSGAGPNNLVQVVSLLGSGKVLIGGLFTTVHGTNRNFIARLSNNGAVDPTFDAGFIGGSTISAIAVQSDGRILVGGSFTSINGYSRINIARLNADGDLDTTFVTPFGVNSAVSSIRVQADGKVVIGGSFSTAGGLTRQYVARLNSNGSLDAGFRPQINDPIGAVAVQSDGKILIAGNFTTVNGTNVNRIARLRGDEGHGEGSTLLSAKAYAGISLTGVVSNTYRIEYVTNLHRPTMWTPWTNVTLPASPYLIIDTDTPVGSRRFYRAVELPN